MSVIPRILLLSELACFMYLTVTWLISERYSENSSSVSSSVQFVSSSISFCGSAFPYDNALMENFFGTFKTECLYRCKPATGKQVQQLVDEYIQFYNYERIDMKYGLTPFEIRSKAA